MRVRKRAWATQVLQENTLVINDAPEKKGKWREYFGNDNPIYVEIGCGKGGFLRKNAETYPDVNFIGIEQVGKDSRLAWIAYKYYAQKDLWVFIYEAN